MSADNLPVVQSTTAVTVGDEPLVPRLVADAGDAAAKRFLEFFAVTIRNPNTRTAYIHACRRFFGWCDRAGIGQLVDIEPIHVAAYIENMTVNYEAPSVKQHLAALRMLFDWLIVGQILAINPAHAVRGPKHSTLRGKTPVLVPEQARLLLDVIELKNEVAYRDRALIGLMVFSFARISAALSLRVEDYAPRGKRWWLSLREKGGKRHEMPVHHTLEAYLDDYIEMAGLKEDSKGFLFRAADGRLGRLTKRPFNRKRAWDMVRRRARHAGIHEKIGNHSFRATGITAYLDAGGALENAQGMAAHSDPKTTKLYDRTGDEVSLDEVERIQI
ncbi:tyrosine-type recombinase/integrase [Pelagibius sp. Alg239-R121]|uniref:tyrosine-type recombinase/integrase n=1 Tax=Pelagibius sp. Alg239-R121 TaxID=2993448 RepID=UPI0024A7011F|nr:tyrosine-type recombinase/integrase [Pelagibius sp. Alg239-R121]